MRSGLGSRSQTLQPCPSASERGRRRGRQGGRRNKENKEGKGEEDKARLVEWGDGGPEMWRHSIWEERLGPRGGAAPPTLMLQSPKAAPGWGLWGEECLSGGENALGSQATGCSPCLSAYTHTHTPQKHIHPTSTHLHIYTHKHTLIHKH